MSIDTLLPDAELREYLLSFDMFEKLGRPRDGEEYIDYHLQRFRKTLELLPQLPGKVRVLELGASPFFMTFLIQKYFGYSVDTTNFFGDYGSPTGGEERVTITSNTYHESHEYIYPIFNLETDSYPFADHSFDIVLCCEILEHLIMHPSHMLAEIHRILKPGGYLLLTTPNIASLKNAILLLKGKNIQHAYSGYGIYGRHNREFTAAELSDLLKLHCFDAQVTVDDVRPSPRWMRLLTQLKSFR
jgi:SAM-dependent methyltransferase